jgi:RNA polymerase sigma-70 factor (ECF subfamily)
MIKIDPALIRRAQQGHVRSFDQIVDHCYALVYNIALRLLGDTEQACDATQETFVRAYEKLPQFRLESSFTTWIYRVATNICLDQLRRGRRAPLTGELSSADDDNPGVRDVPNGSAGPDVRAEQREQAVLVHGALQRLAADHRAIIVLFDLQGLSYQDVVEALGIPLGTVKSRLNRARLALRDELAPHRELFGV